MRSRKSRGLRGYSCGSASARGVSNDTSSSSWAGGVVDSFDRALLSSVSAKVIRLLGVSNDLRDRGDEWPLLPVVSGLSVVVATVVDEVSMVLAALRHRCGWLYFLWCSSAAAMAWPRLKLGMRCRGAPYVSERCLIARLRSATAAQARWPNLA